MENKIKFYKQVKTLWQDEKTKKVSFKISDLSNPSVYSKVGTKWFTVPELNHKLQNHMLVQVNGEKWVANSDDNVSAAKDEHFYIQEAFQEVDPTEKDYKKAKKTLLVILLALGVTLE